MSSALLQELRDRGLIFQIAGEDDIHEWLEGGARTLYCGFDPTADSLHIGSLVPPVDAAPFSVGRATSPWRWSVRCHRPDRRPQLQGAGAPAQYAGYRGIRLGGHKLERSGIPRSISTSMPARAIRRGW